MTRFFNLLAILAATFLASCSDDSRFFEQHIAIENASWDRQFVPQVEFEIEDTSLQYHLVYTIRNGVNYPYYNLYVESELIDSSGLIVETFSKELYLFDASTGKPFGTGNHILNSSLGDIFDGRYLCKSYQKFPRKGKYIFTIKQGMRGEEPLEEILAVGLRIEKAILRVND